MRGGCFRLLILALLLACSRSRAAYDRSITTFSPSGDLLQVSYAEQATARGGLTTALTNSRDCIVLCAALPGRQGAGKGDDAAADSLRKLEVVSKTSRKIRTVDEGHYAAFAGLSSDSRVLLSVMRRQVQEEKELFGEAPSPTALANAVGRLQHSCTRTGGMRPLGISCLIAGFDESDKGRPCLLKTEPSGATSEWKGAAMGKNSDKVLKELESISDTLNGMDGDELASHAALALLQEESEGCTCEVLVITRLGDGSVVEKWKEGKLESGAVKWLGDT